MRRVTDVIDRRLGIVAVLTMVFFLVPHAWRGGDLALDAVNAAFVLAMLGLVRYCPTETGFEGPQFVLDMLIARGRNEFMRELTLRQMLEHSFFAVEHTDECAPGEFCDDRCLYGLFKTLIEILDKDPRIELPMSGLREQLGLSSPFNRREEETPPSCPADDGKSKRWIISEADEKAAMENAMPIKKRLDFYAN